MRILDKTKQLLEDYIKEIEANDFRKIYLEAEENEADWDIVSNFTQVLLTAGIDPLGPESNLDFIPAHYLEECPDLYDIVIPARIQEICENAFCACINLHNVTFEKGSRCSYIDSKAFSQTQLEMIELPEGLHFICRECFSYCSNLKRVVIPRSIETIEQGVFDNCRELKSLNYLGSKSSWNEDIALDCFDTDEDSIERIVCSDGVINL